jgi:hypothetical protein
MAFSANGLQRPTLWNPTDRPIFQAVRDGLYDTVRLLVDHCAGDTNARNSVGHTLAHVAAREGDDEMLRLLHSYGADVDVASNADITPLHVAAENGWGNALVALHTLGADFDRPVDELGTTVVHLLASYGYTDALFAVYDIGLDMSVSGGFGKTPAATALAFGHGTVATVIKTLVARQRWLRACERAVGDRRRDWLRLAFEQLRERRAFEASSAAFAAHVAADAAAYEADVGEHLAPQEPCAAVEPAAKRARLA